MNFLIVFVGGGIGAAARHGLGVVGMRLGLMSPLVTMSINVAGSLMMGMVVGYFAFAGHASQHWRLFLTTGFLGGFTTFSTFSLDVVLFYERGETLAACAYVLASALGAISAAFAGLAIMRSAF
ncbi:fluoride efflux transporter CrcB [Methylocystis parvus]|uniref:fluoride efflux transporter CrcB n=1 Tax=Methylocystis parvus TaxID=134 RepID=UPI003C740AAC